VRAALLVVVGLAPVIGGCEDVPQPFDLDHARIMAVRVEPPALAAGERARVDVLVTDSSVVPRVADAAAFTLASPGGATVVREADGWYVEAPGSEVLAAMRDALALAPDADVIVPLAIDVATPDGALAAQKTIALGTPAANPAVPAILVDGVAPAGAATLAPGRDAVLATPSPGADLSYRWFSSVGDVTGYTRAEATLEPVPGAAGHLALVVRDQAGGTAWTLVPAAVEPEP
jgi:hypothetical protein